MFWRLKFNFNTIDYDVHVVLNLLSYSVINEVVQADTMLLVVNPRPNYIVTLGPGERALALSFVIHPLACIFAPASEGKRTLALPFILLPLALIFVIISPDIRPVPLLQVIDIVTEIVITAIRATSPNEATWPIFIAVFKSTFVCVATLVNYNARPIESFTYTIDEALELLSIGQDRDREEHELPLKAILRQGRHRESYRLL